MATAVDYYEIKINDPALNESGFTMFRLPLLNGKGKTSNSNGDARMILHNEYDRSKITYSPFDRLDLHKSVKQFKDKLLSEQFIDTKTIEDLVTLFRNECLILREDKTNDYFFKDGNGKTSGPKKTSSNKQQQGEQKQPPKRQFTAYKYSNKGKGPLYEAIILAGRPVFLTYVNGKIESYDAIEEDIRIIKPPHLEHYPYDPVEFENMDEVLKYRDKALSENIDSLYLQAKQIAADYNDQNKDKVNLLAIEIIASYFQDKFPTTHYDIVLGGNGSGKSTYGDTFTAVGYRVVNLTDPNAANINRILGCIEIGQCCIVSDETGAIDKHQDLMSILKTGYSARGRTSKINDNTRDPEYFFTYCFKMIISERMPNLRDARGVLDRSFSFTTYKGLPRYDIKVSKRHKATPVTYIIRIEEQEAKNVCSRNLP